MSTQGQEIGAIVLHNYSIDKHPKEKVLFVLALVAITLAPLLNGLLKEAATALSVGTGWSIPATTVSIFGLFGGLYWLFNEFLWKCAAFRRVLLVPDLNGSWNVNGRTFLKNGQSADFDWNGIITITQSWSKIQIHLKTKQSSSHSVSASLQLEEGNGYRLIYSFQNDPGADQLELEKHSGTAEFVFAFSCDEAEGNYYTDRHRNTVGTMKLGKKNV